MNINSNCWENERSTFEISRPNPNQQLVRIFSPNKVFKNSLILLWTTYILSCYAVWFFIWQGILYSILTVKRNLDTRDMWLYRKIMRIPRNHRVSTDEVLRKMETKRIFFLLRIRRRYLELNGQIMRKDIVGNLMLTRHVEECKGQECLCEEIAEQHLGVCLAERKNVVMGFKRWYVMCSCDHQRLELTMTCRRSIINNLFVTIAVTNNDTKRFVIFFTMLSSYRQIFLLK